MTTRTEKMDALRTEIDIARAGKDTERLAALLKEAEQFNFCAKTVKPDQAYEVWTNSSWRWLVLKKYSAPVKEAADSYARWFCLVDGDALELGDVYVRDITRNAVKLDGAAAEQVRAEIAARYRY